MAVLETSRSKIVVRLTREGWISEGGAKHDKFAHPNKTGLKIMVPRHNALSPGVVRNIAKAAGW
jgi:predicted RNA binding protein YcfA (HicA-like mRNA interferase family)